MMMRTTTILKITDYDVAIDDFNDDDNDDEDGNNYEKDIYLYYNNGVMTLTPNSNWSRSFHIMKSGWEN